MTVFWIVIGVMTIVVIGLMVRPLLVHRADDGLSRADFDIAVFKDQLAELARDHDSGMIGDAEYTAARTEIERRLLTAAHEGKSAEAAGRAVGGRATAVVVGIGLPVAALAVYLQLGAPHLPDRPFAARTDTGGGAVAHTAPSTTGGLGEMVERLSARLTRNPDDLDGWVLLARTLIEMKQFDKAADAYGRAVVLSDRHPALLADHAEARLMAGGGSFTPAIHADFVAAFQAEPALPKPWYYLGLDRAMGGNYRGAVEMWTDLIAISDSDAPFLQAVRQQIAKAARDGGFDAAEVHPSEGAQRLVADRIAGPAVPSARSTGAEQVGAGVGAPALSQEQMQSVAGMSSDDQQAMIRSMVQRLADRLEDNPNDRDGWLRLARAYEVLGEAQKAKDAQARAKALE